MKRFLVGVLLLVLVLVISIYFVSRENGEDNSSAITVGFVGPLTGPAASFGMIGVQTLQIAQDEINASGGIDGRELSFIYEDGRCEAKTAASAASKLVNVDKVRVLISVCTAETLSAAPITESNKVLHLGAWPTGASVSEAGDYVFRVSYSDRDVARMFSTHIEKAHSRVAIVSEMTSYPLGLRDLLVAELDGELLQEGVPQNDIDVRSQMTKVIAWRPDAIILNPDTTLTGLAMIRQLQELGYKGPLYGNYFGGFAEILSESGAEGMIYVADPSVSDGSAKARVIAEYERRYGTKPDLEYAMAATYDAVHILALAIEAAGTDPTAIRDWLYAMPDYDGLLGRYHFDENGDITGAKPEVLRIVNGKAVSIEDLP